MANRKLLYFLFFVSGFCSLVYQMIWTRLAFASFGIITPVLSVVLSVFMLGLSVGAWAGGRVIPWLTRKSGLSAIVFYGGAEWVIGLGAFATPVLFAIGERWLLAAGETDSFRYLFLSALVLAASILPWCLCMGATFPWMMAFVREHGTDHADSFSFLYFANVLGAMTGTIVTAYVLVELVGFHRALAIAAAGNFLIGLLSVRLGMASRGATREMEPAVAEGSPSQPAGGGLFRWILFTTGFSAMAMEVVWTRAFVPILKTQVYSFALIVFTYLGATFLGSLLYRWHLRRNARRTVGELVALLSLTAFLPILALDPRMLPASAYSSLGDNAIHLPAVMLALASICPICCVLGYLTPSLIDQCAGGHPAAAGKAYGINVIGCILGPLCASYILLPRVSERYAMVILGLPLLGLVLFAGRTLRPWQRGTVAVASAAALVWCVFLANDFEGLVKGRMAHTVVRRDYAASVISYGDGFGRRLLVNGIGMTVLTPETKFMVHLPMALHKGRPESVLIICFGMGTSYRSALSWDIPTTVVELVPSVTKAFPFYHSNAMSALQNPRGRIVIDDGRRFLERTREKYDVVVIDPPPPVETAGSSLLYSREFYDLVKGHMKPDGILQIWLPEAPPATLQAASRSVAESFPFVRVFPGLDCIGTHFLASMQPMPKAGAPTLAARMPPKARADLVEWPQFTGPSEFGFLEAILAREQSMGSLLNADKRIQITDDQPFNEYFLLRSLGWHSSQDSQVAF